MVGAWCIMTNHVHMIIASDGSIDLEDIIRDLKSFTSRHIRKFIESSPYESRKNWMLELMKQAGTLKSNNKDFQFWQQHNHPIELSNQAITEQKINYIHTNPVKAGFVESPEHWLPSSARDYAGLKGELEIYFLK
jgi:REP element-mobilizing transposase RayT